MCSTATGASKRFQAVVAAYHALGHVDRRRAYDLSAGIVPTVWSWLRVPVLRWLAAGVVAGVPVGWLALLVS